MEIFPFKALYPKLDLISSIDSFFGTVKQDFKEYYASGFFRQHLQEALYVYQIKTDRRTYLGIIGCIDIKEYTKGNIRKHEQTLAYKMQKQVALALQRKASVKPVLLTYPFSGIIGRWAEAYIQNFPEPFFSLSFQEEQTEHTFWKVDDSHQIEQIQALFREHLPVAYIADGHHRSAAQAFMFKRGVEKSQHARLDRLLCAFFSYDQLEILDFNRIVMLDSDFSASLFMARLSSVCNIAVLEEVQKPGRKHEFIMGYNQEWYRVTWKKEVIEHPEGADHPDTYLLNEMVLKNFLGIEDVRSDQRIIYIEGPKGLDAVKRKARSSPHNLAFILFPVQIDDFFKLVDNGSLLPPKSTWFEPRMKNGLLVHSFF